jgi:hypothetical protein
VGRQNGLGGEDDNGYGARRLQAAEAALKDVQQWHRRARVVLEKCQHRRERLLMLSKSAA